MKGNIMQIKLTTSFLGMALLFAAHSAFAAAKPGEPAPGFTLKDVEGTEHTLADHKGKFVVLEWVNYDCPFVRKHYESENMPTLQKKWKEKDVIWYSVNSSAEGKQGHFEIPALKERIAKEKADPTAYLLDTDGTVGRLYGAKTTPHMYVINPEGVLIYAGAIDDKPTTKIKDVKKAKNYLEAALEAGIAGKPVATASTNAYGCSVKY